jgi:hypothetical protein
METAQEGRRHDTKKQEEEGRARHGVQMETARKEGDTKSPAPFLPSPFASHEKHDDEDQNKIKKEGKRHPPATPPDTHTRVRVVAVQPVLHMALLVPVRVHGRRLGLDVRGHRSGDGRGPIRVLCAPVVCRSDQLELEPGPWICCACCPTSAICNTKQGVGTAYRYVDAPV